MPKTRSWMTAALALCSLVAGGREARAQTRIHTLTVDFISYDMVVGEASNRVYLSGVKRSGEPVLAVVDRSSLAWTTYDLPFFPMAWPWTS